MIEVEMKKIECLHDMQAHWLENGIHVPIAVVLGPNHCVAVNDEHFKPYLVPHTVWVAQRTPDATVAPLKLLT